MPQETGRTGHDSGTEPAIGWDFGSAGWSVAYAAAPVYAADEGPEAIAMRLWSEGRREEALAFLEGRIARQRSQADGIAPVPAAAGSLARAGGALVPLAPAGGPEAPPPAETSSPAEASGMLIHIAPEPRVGDAGRSRRAQTRGIRPSLVMAAGLVVASMGIGAAFWRDSGRGPVETAEPAKPIAALPIERPEQTAALQSAPPSGESRAVDKAAAAPADLRGGSSGGQDTPEPVAQPATAAAERPAVAESATRATPAEAAPPAAAEQAPRPVVTAGAEPAAPAASPEPAPRAVATARLPNPRPRFAQPRPASPTYREPEELAAADMPPPGPEDEYDYPPETGDGYLPDARYEDLPPALAQRRAAAERYAAARRRAAAGRMEEPQGPVVFREAPVFTIEGPVILRGLP